MYRLRQLILLSGDILSLYAGLYLALFLRYQNRPGQGQWDALITPMSWLFLAAVLIAFIAGLYDIGRAKNNWRFFERILISALVWIMTGVLFFYVYPQNNLVTPKTILILTALCGFGLISLWRYFHNRFLSAVILKTNIIFIGAAPETLEIIKIIQKNPERGYLALGLVDPESASPLARETAGLLPVAQNLKSLSALLGKFSPHIFVIAPQFVKNEELLKDLYSQLFRQVEMTDLAKFYEEITGRIPPFTFSESWFLTNLREQQKKIYDRIHILVDYLIALILAVFFIISFPIIALAIKLNSRGPVLFRQERVGRNGKTFHIYKYRTMKAVNADGSAETNGPVFAAAGDTRITLVGRFLRRTRLDEIPQFINILSGEMSLVGPRPERPEFVRQLTEAMPFYALRHLVKPGLTGWAQLQGYSGTIDENLRKLEYDLYYIKNRGPLLDAAIILRTINVIVKMAGR